MVFKSSLLSIRFRFLPILYTDQGVSILKPYGKLDFLSAKQLGCMKILYSFDPEIEGVGFFKLYKK
jgi:hypothetical protein